MTSQDFANHFSSLNIPFGVATSPQHGTRRAVTRIENTVIFLEEICRTGIFDDIPALDIASFSEPTLNSFAALGKSVQGAVRQNIQDAFAKNGLDAFPEQSKEDIEAVVMHLPVEIRDFADFSCSLEHMKNAGRIVINDERLPPGALHFPIGYQGRASSVVVSGTDIVRPRGQYAAVDGPDVRWQPTAAMDYELEFGVVVGKPVSFQERLKAVDADEHIFGFVLVNDWSARDIQGFEMRPLGPFNGKSCGTSISPWIVSSHALEPYRMANQDRQVHVPGHLDDGGNATYDISLKAEIGTGSENTVVAETTLSNMYWSARQLLAHSVSAGAGLRTGDLLATGTISGPADNAKGCLLETTNGGKDAIRLRDGSTRGYLQDGDVVRFTAMAGSKDSGVGFGDCVGKLLPSRR